MTTLARTLYEAACRKAEVSPVPASDTVPYGHWQTLLGLFPKPERVAWKARLQHWRQGRRSPRPDDLPRFAQLLDADGTWSGDGFTLSAEAEG